MVGGLIWVGGLSGVWEGLIVCGFGGGCVIWCFFLGWCDLWWCSVNVFRGEVVVDLVFRGR